MASVLPRCQTGRWVSEKFLAAEHLPLESDGDRAVTLYKPNAEVSLISDGKNSLKRNIRVLTYERLLRYVCSGYIDATHNLAQIIIVQISPMTG